MHANEAFAYFARADVLGQKPADAVLGPEMVRVFRGLTARSRRACAGNRLRAENPLSSVGAEAILPILPILSGVAFAGGIC